MNNQDGTNLNKVLKQERKQMDMVKKHHNNKTDTHNNIDFIKMKNIRNKKIGSGINDNDIGTIGNKTLQPFRYKGSIKILYRKSSIIEFANNTKYNSNNNNKQIVNTIWFHKNDVKSINPKSLRIGYNVTFNIISKPNRITAVNVKIVRNGNNKNSKVNNDTSSISNDQ